MAYTPKLVPAVYIVLLRNNGTEILMSRRFNTGYEDGKYGLVAGHVDEGEMPSTAMLREAREEAGITLESDHIEHVHTMYREGSQDMRMDMFFSATKWQGEVVNMEPHKCDDLAWFPMQAMPENTIPYIRSAVEHVLGSRSFSEFELVRESATV